jgi:chitodextrinase
MRRPREMCEWASAACAACLALAAPERARAADATPPTQPGPVTVSAVTASSAALSWAGSTDNVRVAGYRVYHAPAGAALRQIATTDAVRSYRATRLYSGTAHTFGIAAIDAANNASPIRTVTLTTADSSDASPPVPPSSGSVLARPFSSSRIDVSWGASTSTDVVAYQVIRDGTLVATVPLPGGLRRSDNGLGAQTAHRYVVKAVDAARNVSAGTRARTASTLAAGTAQIARGPYLSNVMGRSAVVSWWTNIPTPGVVSWGLASATERSARDPAGSVWRHSVTIRGLRPGRTYRYQVGNGAGLVSAASTFRSAAPPGQGFTFAVIGDYGAGGAGATQNAARIAAAGTSFLLTVGDNVYPSAGHPDPNFLTTYSDFDHRFYRPFGPAIARQAFVPANGNKEYYGLGAFWANFPMPGSNHSWYGYDWGDAHILVLDTEQPFAPGTPQYAFAAADLAAHQRAGFRIVVVHVPPYSSTTAATGWEAVQQQLVPLFQQQRVSLVLSGDSHNYERTHPMINGVPAAGGVTYVVTGGGGNGLNKFTIPPPAWSAFRQDAYFQHLRIGVTPQTLTLLAVRADTNAVFDSAAIPAPAKLAPPTARAWKRLARWRLKRRAARRALARGWVRIPRRRLAPTVISVRVRGRLAARRRVATKRALKIRLARWTAKRRYRRSAITVTIWRPVALPRGRDAASGSSRLTAGVGSSWSPRG